MAETNHQVGIDDSLVQPVGTVEPKGSVGSDDLQAFDDLDDVEFLLEEIENRIAPLA